MITLTETTRFPCTLQFVNTAIALRADPGGSVEEIGSTVARGPDGRFYTSMSRAGSISVWKPDGTWLRNFGTYGQGPGELARGTHNILFDKAGRLYVGDNNRRWTIFSPTYEFVRTVPGGAMGTGALGSAALLDDGNLVSSFKAAGGAFHIYDVTQTTATVPPVVRSMGPALQMGGQRISHAGGNTFWTAPPDGEGLGYVLEQWRTDGTLVRTIRRAVPWMRSGDAAKLGSPLPPPEIEGLHDDGTGIVYVTLMVPNKTFLDITPEQRRDRSPDGAMNKSIDIYIEAIDVNAGVVLGAIGPIHPAEATKLIPLGYLRASRLAYRREEDADGFPIMRIVEAQLTSAAGSRKP
ncbi:MAG TPA: hypothetical protein VJR92_15225 [Gemmatimonadaceae bacterium]|nr:hypothetical protein [Gemmatimonadaceae bacterium]